jgi:hypothetical protein
MCSTTKDECSHIVVQPHVAGLVLTLEAIARTSCADHADVILKAVCLLRHTFAEPHHVLAVPPLERLAGSAVS